MATDTDPVTALHLLDHEPDVFDSLCAFAHAREKEAERARTEQEAPRRRRESHRDRWRREAGNG